MSIAGKEVALILSDYFDAVEFSGLHSCLFEAGALVSIVGEEPDKKLKDWDRNAEAVIEVSYEEARSYDFEAVVISGRYAPDTVRADTNALDFVLSIHGADKIVGAIDHGAQVLISLDLLKNKNVTGWPSIKVDLENAGAHYVDEPVVIDGNLVTGRGPADVRQFCEALIEEIERTSEAAA